MAVVGAFVVDVFVPFRTRYPAGLPLQGSARYRLFLLQVVLPPQQNSMSFTRASGLGVGCPSRSANLLPLLR